MPTINLKNQIQPEATIKSSFSKKGEEKKTPGKTPLMKWNPWT